LLTAALLHVKINYECFLKGPHTVNRLGTILIVNNSAIDRKMLCDIFCESYGIIEARDGRSALALLEAKQNVSAIILALTMPGLSGLDVLRRLKESGIVSKIPVFLTTDTVDTDLLREGYLCGAVDLIKKPYSKHFLEYRIHSMIELFSYRHRLEDIIKEQNDHLNELMHGMLSVLATAIEFRDCESGEHVKRICQYTKKLMLKVSEMYPKYRMPYEEIEKIAASAVLHDIGKIAIPDMILNKPSKLTREEFEIIMEHTVRGSELLERVPNMLDKGVYRYAHDICRFHHERYDGGGYPDGLVGDDIPIWAQVAGVADVYDALTSKRIYKESYTHDVAVKMILDGECGVFNPKVMEAFKVASSKSDFMEPAEQ